MLLFSAPTGSSLSRVTEDWGAQGKSGNRRRGEDVEGELLRAQSGAAQKASKLTQGRVAERREAVCRVKGRQERRW